MDKKWKIIPLKIYYVMLENIVSIRKMKNLSEE